MANLKDTIVLGNLTVTGTITGTIPNINADMVDGIHASSLLRYYNHEPAAVNIDYVDAPSYLLTVNSGWLTPVGTKPNANYNNAFGVLHVRTHSTGYATQLGFGNDNASGDGARIYARFANNSSSFGSWQPLAFKSEVDNCVKLSGDQTIAGAKTFTGNIYFSSSSYCGIGYGTIPTQFVKEYGPSAIDGTCPIWIASSGASNQIEGAGILIDGQTIQMWAPKDAHPTFMDSDNGSTEYLTLSSSVATIITVAKASLPSSRDSKTLYFCT